MNIIVEGIDKAGKSTLINKLVNSKCLKPVSSVHFTAPKDPGCLHPGDVVLTHGIPVFYQFYNYMITNCCSINTPWAGTEHPNISNKHKHKHLIFDRHLYSDIIYGPIFRDAFKGDKWYVRDTERAYMELLLQAMGTVLVYCENSNIDISLKALEEENEGIFTTEMYVNTRKQYNELFNSITCFPKMKYDWATHLAKDVEDFIIHWDTIYSKNTLYTAIQNFKLAGQYLGPVLSTPSKIIQLDVSSNIITYNDYISYQIRHPEVIWDNTVGFVKKKSAAEAILSNLNLVKLANKK